LGAVVGLAFVFEDPCDGIGTTEGRAVVLTGVCLGGLVLTVLSGRFKTHPWMPWAAAGITATVSGVAVYVLFVLTWVGECSN
jgi:hypothetical protein